MDGRRWSDGGGVAGFVSAEAGEDLHQEVVGGAGIVGQEEGVGAALGADVFEGVEVLGEEDEGHDVFGGGSGDGFAEVLDGGAEAVDDGLTLGGDALALEGLGLGFGFGLFDFEDLVGFAAGLCCDLCALGGVDVVHRGFHFDVGDDVGDERVEDVEAEVGHGGVVLGFEGDGDAGLLLEGLVEGEFVEVAEDGVEDEGLDLLLRGAEFVEGVVDLVVENLVLDGDGDLDEDVVVGLGFDGELSLLDLEVDEVDTLGEGDEDVKAGADDAVEFAEALDYTSGVGAHGEEGFEDGDENDDADKDQEDEQSSIQRIHRYAYLCRVWVPLQARIHEKQL